MPAFLAWACRCSEIRKHAGDGTDLMTLTPNLGKDLAQKLGKDAADNLMRGHAIPAVAPSLPNAVFRAYYTEVKTRQQPKPSPSAGRSILYDRGRRAHVSTSAMLRALCAAGAVARSAPWRSAELKGRTAM